METRTAPAALDGHPGGPTSHRGGPGTTRPLSWPYARQIALTRAEWRCEICGIPDWHTEVQVHHIVPVEDYRPGPQHDPAGLVALCSAHHREIHRAMRHAAYQLSLIAA